MSHSHWQAPTTSAASTWDGREHYYSKHDSRPQQHYYPPPPASARSLSSSTVPRLPPRPQKFQWPPRPFVEDEAKSIAREYGQSVPAEDEIPLRGSRDQNPIILEADASSDDEFILNRQRRRYDRTDSSSTETSGPSTPSDGNHDEERRFIFVPKNEGHDGSDEEEHPRRGSYVRVRGNHNAAPSTRSKSSARPELKVDPKVSKEKEPLPYIGPRTSTPYTHTSNASKSKLSGDYLLSPESIAPGRKLPGAHAEPRGRQYDLKQTEMKRTASSSNVRPDQRPVPPRHSSAIGVPGETVRSSSYEPPPRQGRRQRTSTTGSRRHVSPFRDLSDSDVCDSDSETESDLSPNEASPQRHSRRNTPYSMTASDLRQTSTTVKESMRKTRPDPISTRPVRQDSVHTNESMPKTPSSVKSTSSTFRQEMQQKPSSPSVRPNTFGKTPDAMPHTSRESTQSYHHAPPSPRTAAHIGSHPNSRPGSREGSKPISRSSTPEQQHRPMRQSTLDVPKDQKPHGVANGSSQSHHTPSHQSIPQNIFKLHSKLDQHEETRQRPAPNSRHTSPLPSPNGDKGHFENGSVNGTSLAPDSRSGTFPVTGTGHSTHSRESSIGQSVPFVANHNRLVAEPAEVPGRRSMESHSARNSAEMTRPPAFQFKPTLKRAPPPGIPMLPACPRPHFEEGYSDWSTLPGHPNFDICPTCREALEDGGFEDQFIPSPRRPQNYSTRCDLSVPWIRMAWLLLLQDRAKDRNIVNTMTTVLAHEPKCPGKQLSQRTWHRLFDPEANRYVQNFDACSACVKSVEQLFPNLQGALHVVPLPPAQNARNCDLRTDSHRFARYVDMLENVSTQAAEQRREPNMHRFVLLARQLASIRECSRDDQLYGQPWHYSPHTPDFTVCEECYGEIVWPAVKGGSEVAGQFNRTLQLLPMPQAQMGVSCQLYSERTRKFFRDAVQKRDWVGLRQKILARVGKERELQRRHREIQAWKDEDARLEEGSKLVREWARWA